MIKLYKSGRLSTAETTALIFFSTFTPFFLSLWSVTYDTVSTSAWLVPAIASLGSITALGILCFIASRVKGDLIQISQTLLGKAVAKIIAAFYILLFFGDGAMLIRQFAENSLITALPTLNFTFTVLWFAFIPAILAYSGIGGIARPAAIVLPLAIVSLLFVVGLLVPKCNILYLAPWKGNGLLNLVQNSLQISGFHFAITVPFLLLPAVKTVRAACKAALGGVLISFSMRTMAVTVYGSLFGALAGREKTFPFYEMARLVYINRYLQRIEAVFILLWVAFGMISIALDLFMVVYLIARISNLPSLRPIIPLLAVIMAVAASIPSDLNTTITIYVRLIRTVDFCGVYIIPLILFIAAIIRGKAGEASDNCPEDANMPAN